MEKDETILSELREISPVIASINKQEIYIVPDKYFNTLADRILDKIAIEGLEETSKRTLLTVPKGYFDHLASDILTTIHSQKSETYTELEEVAPLLNTINKQPVYQVPTGYFQRFTIESVSSKKPTATILSFHKTRKWISYAAAAMMAGLLVTGAFLHTDRPASFDLSKEVNKLSDDELNSYLISDQSTVFTSDSVNLDSEPDVESNLKLISDEELKQYLEENQETDPSKDHKGANSYN